ncbi:integrase, catalytic region, zinc finger, CCHC-type containing protein [Tanacetum coccineum]
MLKTSPICLLSKASKTKNWLWHRRLSHLKFGTINKLAKDGLARGIPHLCSACALGKSKKSSHQPKAEDTNQEKLYLLHMDFVRPMRVAILIEKNNGTEFVNQTLREFYENVGISLREFYENVVQVAATPRAVDIAGLPSSTTIDQEAPSRSSSSTNQQEQSLIISRGVEEPIPNAHFNNPCHEPLHNVSTSQELLSNVHSSHSLLELISKWTKDHPLENMIGNPSRPISTRKQLKTDAIWC